MKLIIHVDGAAKGNPGPAGAGIVLQDETGAVVAASGFPLGKLTNNQAEYRALILALEEAVTRNADCVEVQSDSELMVRQVRGEYQVKSLDLRPLHGRVLALLKKIGHWSIRHVPRGRNARADKLANMAIQAGRRVVDDELAGGLSRDRLSAGLVAQPPAGGAETEAEREQNEDADDADSAVLGRAIVMVTVAEQNPAGLCPAGCEMAKGREFCFFLETPAGLCLNAAGDVIGAVLKLMKKERGASGPSPTVSCPFAGCNVRMRIATKGGRKGRHS